MQSRWKNPFLYVFLIFVLLSVYFAFHIVNWYITTNENRLKLRTIQSQEVVGVEVKPEKVELEVALGQKVEREFPFVEVDFTDLKKRNEDTVAWLKINTINLDMPIVQTTDNEFYLYHDIDKRKSNLGWVFADVYSNIEHLGTNTVLYGHNAASQEMFGSLKNLYNIDEDRLTIDNIIQFTTENRQMVFEIVSMYITDYDDWMYVDQIFTDDEERQAFIDRMVDRNEVKMFEKINNRLSVNDKFLTFSTCHGPQGTTKRLVVHAKLLAEKSNLN